MKKIITLSSGLFLISPVLNFCNIEQVQKFHQTIYHNQYAYKPTPNDIVTNLRQEDYVENWYKFLAPNVIKLSVSRQMFGEYFLPLNDYFLDLHKEDLKSKKMNETHISFRIATQSIAIFQRYYSRNGNRSNYFNQKDFRLLALSFAANFKIIQNDFKILPGRHNYVLTHYRGENVISPEMIREWNRMSHWKDQPWFRENVEDVLPIEYIK